MYYTELCYGDNYMSTESSQQLSKEKLTPPKTCQQQSYIFTESLEDIKMHSQAWGKAEHSLRTAYDHHV